MIQVVPDLDLLELSLWLADLKAAPFVAHSLSATIGTISQHESKLRVSA